MENKGERGEGERGRGGGDAQCVQIVDPSMFFFLFSFFFRLGTPQLPAEE